MKSPFAVWLALASAALAQLPTTPDSVDWEKIRNAQPPGLELRMELPKKRFLQGEVIDATLVFFNRSENPCHLWTGTYDRSGRIPDISFYAQDADGKFAPDPLRWYFERGGASGGLGNVSNLGKWEIKLAANEWLRFDRPGAYEIFAYSYRVKPGTRDDRKKAGTAQIELVSNREKIVIDPLDEKTEKQMIDSARRGLASGGQAAANAAAQLRYLQTEAARAELLPLLDDDNSFEAYMALCAAPDHAAAASAILAAVRDGRLTFKPGIQSSYVTLKTAGFVFDPTMSEAESAKLREAFTTAEKAATAEIVAAAGRAAGGRGPSYYDLLLTKFSTDPDHRVEAVAELAKVQLDLTPEQADHVIASWQDWGDEQFLPLLRKEAGAPRYSSKAMILLAKFRPDEARPLIVEDIQRDKPRYKGSGCRANAAFLSLPREHLPELDAFFRARLNESQPRNVELLMETVERYGDTSLLPDVIKLYARHEGTWACDIAEAALRFWIRCNAKAGIEALRRALEAREHTGCYQRVLGSVLTGEWTPLAEPLLAKALDDPDPEVVESAIKVLSRNGDAKWIEPSLAAAERMAAAAAASGPQRGDAGAARRIADILLGENSDWTLDETQRERMKKVRSDF